MVSQPQPSNNNYAAANYALVIHQEMILQFKNWPFLQNISFEVLKQKFCSVTCCSRQCDLKCFWRLKRWKCLLGYKNAPSPWWLQLQKIITHPSTGSHLDSGGQVCWDVRWSNVIDSSAARFYRAWNWFPCYQNTLSKSPISREQ